MKEIVIMGGRGNGTVIASTIEDCKQAGEDVELKGFLNDTRDDEINGYPVIGGIKSQDIEILPDSYEFICALSTVTVAPERYDLLQSLGIPEDRFTTVIHPDANVSNQAKIGNGVVLMPQAVVGPDVELGNHTQLYAQSFVGHDTTLEEMVFVANNASVGGRIAIETGAHIGSNSSILERTTIGEFAVVGLGSVVLDNVAPYQKVVGNPAESIGDI